MRRKLLPVILLSCSFAGLLCCNTGPKENLLAKKSRYFNHQLSYSDVRYRDQQRIEKVLIGFCENFDNAALRKCLDYMDDSIHGEIDGIPLEGKYNWQARTAPLLYLIKEQHFQPRRLLSNIQVSPAPGYVVDFSAYATCLQTNLVTGQVQVVTAGYYKGSVVRKANKWLIRSFHSLPDNRLVNQFHQDTE
ncbi:hypothetical protein [Chitinophaga nivalis]|uniref:SnoaL-like domain-containing protein n=1 Tax=Chitinophaga nivalis TaxID=2991709 RepID=A0ABT3IHU3_9BACT|nr:hypothetical protein [Chitinophaga nivalis]MCW3466780.1 hypothetical protein [Chitinophaga nivalis]MCW3483529.1 hypothetical protein [Chitinophaga nivalis]